VLPDDATEAERDAERFRVFVERAPTDGPRVSAPGLTTLSETPLAAPGAGRVKRLRGLPAGEPLTVHVEAEGFLDAALERELPPGVVERSTVVLERGATLRVHVVDEQDAAVQHARVHVEHQGPLGPRPRPLGRSASGETDAAGRSELAGLPAGRTTVNVRAPERAPAQATVELVRGASEELTVVLTRGLVVRGVVRWPDGEPAEGSRVNVDYREERRRGFSSFSSQGTRSAVTDTDGRFELSGLAELATVTEVDAEATPEGARAEALGAEPRQVYAARSLEPDVDAPLELVLAPTLALTGRVTLPGGAGLSERFGLSAWPAGSERFGPLAQRGWFQGETTLAGDPPAGDPPAGDPPDGDPPDGEFVLWGLTAGSWRVQLEAEGFQEHEPVTVELPQAAPLMLTLTPSGVVRGRVVAPEGAPAAGAVVLVVDPDVPFRMALGARAEVDEEGAFELELERASADVFAQHEDWASSESVTVGAGAEEGPLVLELRVGATIRGVVRQEDGTPWPGRMVAATPGPMSPVLMTRMGGGPLPTRTDADGRFELLHVDPGELTVAAAPTEEEIRQRMEAEDGDSELAYVEVMGEILTEQVEVADGETVEVELGATPKRPVRVTGRVLHEGDGVPAQVLVLAAAGSPLAGAKAATADEHGAYELTVDQPGTYTFMVAGPESSGEGEPFVASVPAAAEHRLDFTLASSAIRGRVVGPDGAGLAGIGLVLTPEDGASTPFELMFAGRVESGPDGGFELRSVKAGRYLLRANDALNVGGSSEPSPWSTGLVDGVVVEPGRDVEGLVVRLDSAATLTGVVRHADGSPAAGASVFACDDAGHLVSVVAPARSQADGTYRLPGLPVGRITLSARLGDAVSPAAGPVVLAAGDEERLDLTLAAGTYLVLAPELDDEPVAVRATAHDEAGRPWHGLWSEEDLMRWMGEGSGEGGLRIGPVPPGRYSVQAETLDGGAAADKTVTVREGRDERRVVLRLR